MKRKYTATLTTGMFLVVVTLILICVNVIVAQLPPMRLDLTGNSQYRLSDATRNVLKRLEDPVKVQAYFTKDLPAPYNQNAAYVRDLLEEYATYAGGNLDFEFIDPGTDEAKKREAARKGIHAGADPGDQERPDWDQASLHGPCGDLWDEEGSHSPDPRRRRIWNSS